MKRNARLPSAPVSSTSAPRMSAGIRSGVNCTRCATSPSTVPSVSTSRVFASPGAPTSSPCPPQRMAISVCSTTASWPMIRRAIIRRASHQPLAGRLDLRHQVVAVGHPPASRRRPGVARVSRRRYPRRDGVYPYAAPPQWALTITIRTARATDRPGRRPRRRRRQGRPQGPAAGPSLEPALLRRPRHAHRPRRHLVLPRHPDRPRAAGPALLLDPEARGRPLLPRDPGGEGRHHRRRRPLRRRRLHRRRRRPGADASPSPPTSRTASPPAPTTRSASSATRSPPSPPPTSWSAAASRR